jgi:hypothetical protein
MPVGECLERFAEAARVGGVILQRKHRHQWLNERGHYGLPGQARAAIRPLQRIFDALGGVGDVQRSGRINTLECDLLHEPTGRFIEVDEHQHFTSFRLIALDLYPDDAPLGFDLERYRDLCREIAPRADRYRRTKTARAFGVGGRQRQRAYYDALRDLAAPLMGHGPVVRVDAVDDDGARAWRDNRKRVLELLGSSGTQ